jgi:cupin fold WbuC family metalloprotein
MVNAVEPASYVRPHRHAAPARPEIFVALRGSVLIVRFSDDGLPIEGLVVSVDGPVYGAEIPGGAWHSLVALKSGTVLYEVTQGPYNLATNEEFAPWAPPAEDTEAAQAYIASLKAHFEPLSPELSALDQIEAEEDEIC